MSIIFAVLCAAAILCAATFTGSTAGRAFGPDGVLSGGEIQYFNESFFNQEEDPDAIRDHFLIPEYERPEDIDLVKPEEGTLQGIVTHLIFKGVHYEMEVTTPDGYEWLVHSTDMFPVGEKVGIHVDPFDIQIMNKPASEDEEAVGVNE